jgi:CubicO group peptidase (beta-lactamase class C family)
MKTKIIITLLSGALSIGMASCLKEGPVKCTYSGFKPMAIADDWQVSTPAEENMNEDYLNDAYKLIYNNERFIMARSLLVLRNGKIVAESYPHDPDDAYRIENIQSCTKSFTSILTGIAFEKHYLDSLNQTLNSICPDYYINHQDKKNITIANALTMKTGINFVNGDHTEVLYATNESSVDYILSIPLNYEPGVVFQYNDGSPHLVSAAIQERYGRPLSVFADEFLFKPLGITDWKWESANDGTTFGAFSIFMKPRDLAKFGQLLLQNGKWGNQQVVDSAWIAKATEPVVTTDGPGPCYGYYFWIYPAYGGYAAAGHGGQFIFVVPSKKLVVIYTAWPYTSGDMFDNFGELGDLILRSCN